MKKISLEKIILLVALIILVAGSLLVVFIAKSGSKTNEKAKSGVVTFADYTTCEAFADVPAMLVENGSIGEAKDYGSDNWLLDVDGGTKEDYDAYLKLLEENGFQKHSDNGKEGMEGYVYTSNYMKDDLVLTVSHVVKYEKTYISASKTMALSDHLIYKDEYMNGASADAKTKLHMVQLNCNGNSFVIQLKNGHFIVEDGGIESDAPYLLDYLESLTPAGQKPVIEGWFISHAHGDHHGAIKKIMLTEEYYSRIYVDGIYFVEPSMEADTYFKNDSVNQNTWFIKQAAKVFTASDGGTSEFYRPQLGQRYYFADMSIDITLTLEQITLDSYHSADLNDTSTWLMHNIEGQKFLQAGDAGVTDTKISMMYYDKEYFEMDMFAVLHHGINMMNYFADYCDIKTALYTNFRVGSLWEDGSKYAREAENAYFQATVDECLSHGEGTVILTFPYTVGNAEIAPSFDWRYNDGQPDRKVFE